MLLDFSLRLIRRADIPHEAEGVHIKGQVIQFIVVYHSFGSLCVGSLDAFFSDVQRGGSLRMRIAGSALHSLPNGVSVDCFASCS